MSRYRLEATPQQESILLRHCSDARYIWNLCVEQESGYRPGRGKMPGFAGRCRQLTEARAENPWLAEGSVMVTRSARGTAEQPGRNVAQKAGLNRGIASAGWGLLVRRLQDKAPGRVQQVPPAYTSQRCSACGHTAKESRESQAAFRCVACGFTCNADVNAAKNIAAGHAVKARGGDGTTRPVNREPQLALPA